MSWFSPQVSIQNKGELRPETHIEKDPRWSLVCGDRIKGTSDGQRGGHRTLVTHLGPFNSVQ